MEQVISRLRGWLEESMQLLRNSADKEVASSRKLELDRAIACLELCELHRVDPMRAVVLLPDQETCSPSSEFRVIEDHESDNWEDWVEVQVDGEPVRPFPGDVIFRTIPRPSPG